MNFPKQVGYRLIWFFLSLFLSVPVFAQRVTTVAGGSGDGGQALAADLFGPVGVALDGSGNIFIADAGSRKIRRVDYQTGIITIFAGNGAFGNAGNGGLAINATFGYPSGIAVDVAGNIYVSDEQYSSIRKIDMATGVITHIAGGIDGIPGFTGDNALASGARLNGPRSLTLDATGNIYFVDSGNQRVRKINKVSGIITTVAGNGIFAYSGDDGVATSASLSNPSSVAVDANGNVYIADYQNFRVRKVNSTTGIISTVAGTGIQGYSGDGGLATQGKLDAPSGVILDADGNLIISDTYNQRIRKVDLTTGILNTIAGTGVTGFADGPTFQSKLNVPQGLALDALGNIYFSEIVNRRIRKIVGTTISTVAGNGGFDGDGGLAIDASLKGPQGVTLDVDGNIYISDSQNNRIRKVDHSTGIISTIAGNGTPDYGGDGGPAINALLYLPRGLLFDKDGNLLFTDGGNHSVRVINRTTGIITTIAGIGQFGNGGDNGLASNASLFDPSSITFDSHDNLYIADQLNNKIRKVDALTGIITTIAGDGTNGFAGDNGLAINAKLNYPSKVAFDASGNLIIVDTGNNKIRMVNVATNIITTLISLTPFGELIGPSDIIFVGNDFYILEQYRMVKGNLVTGIFNVITGGTDGRKPNGFFGDNGPAIDAQFLNMTGFVRDQAGNFFIADSQNNRIRKIKARSSQALTFNALADHIFGDLPFDLTASASSGLPITYTSSNLNVATVTGKTVTIIGAGTTTITALQSGNLDYLPSASVSLQLVVNKANQAITFSAISTKTVGTTAFNLEATSTSGLVVVYSSASDKIAISGKEVTLSKSGRVVVRADQAGNSNYLAALTVEQSFCINSSKPTITQQPGISGIVLTSSNNTGNQWIMNGEIITGAIEKTFTAEKVGTYSVKSTTDDCTSAPSDDVVLLITGLQDSKSKAALNIYPNPAEASLSVNFTSSYSMNLVLEINDALGRTISMKTGTTNEEIILDVHKLSPGVYFIKGVSGNEQYIQRFLKK